jgi:hypothetical protein
MGRAIDNETSRAVSLDHETWFAESARALDEKPPALVARLRSRAAPM